MASAWDIPAVTEELLVEVQLGIFENRPEADRQAWKRETGLRFHPSGETVEDVERRVWELLAMLDLGYPEASLLLVTHGMLVLHLLSAVFDEINWNEYGRDYEDGRRVFELRDYD